MLMVVDPQHRYSNEAERANEDIYDNFKSKKKLKFGLDAVKSIYIQSIVLLFKMQN